MSDFLVNLLSFAINEVYIVVSETADIPLIHDKCNKSLNEAVAPR